MPSPRALLVLAALAVLPLGAGACSGDDASSDGAASSDDADNAATDDTAAEITVPAELEDFTGHSEVTVTVVDNAFEQRYIRVDPGTTVTWVNEGTNNHNVIPSVEGAFAPSEDGELPGHQDPPTEVTVTFGDPGEFPYYCSLHGTPTAGQNGFVLVGDA
jgi:plastocyanin